MVRQGPFIIFVFRGVEVVGKVPLLGVFLEPESLGQGGEGHGQIVQGILHDDHVRLHLQDFLSFGRDFRLVALVSQIADQELGVEASGVVGDCDRGILLGSLVVFVEPFAELLGGSGTLKAPDRLPTAFAAIEDFSFKDGLDAVIAAFVGDAEVGLVEINGAHSRLPMLGALLGLQVEDDECGLRIGGQGFAGDHVTPVFFHLVHFSTESASGVPTAVVLNLFSLQQSPAFPVSHPQIAPPQTLADAGKMTVIVRFLLEVAVVAGLIPEVPVTVWTVDPLLEGASRRFPALRAFVRA